MPFVIVHLYLLATLPWPMALASVLLATIISFPLAHLFELGGKTIWPPALLHFTVQGAVKVLKLPGDTLMPLVWIGASATVPWLALSLAVPHASASCLTGPGEPMTRDDLDRTNCPKTSRVVRLRGYSTNRRQFAAVHKYKNLHGRWVPAASRPRQIIGVSEPVVVL